MDRRSQNRCPECQGPGVEDAVYPEGIRCRRSTCIHNHSTIKCPRCEKTDLDHVHYEDGHFLYTCKECTNNWKVVS